ncbi:hypothetical protein N9E90_01325 [Akkermansiaceae bacterium]|nr:hypothetical protein [Akkermansiaceae bacterium]
MLLARVFGGCCFRDTNDPGSRDIVMKAIVLRTKDEKRVDDAKEAADMADDMGKRFANKENEHPARLSTIKGYYSHP